LMAEKKTFGDEEKLLTDYKEKIQDLVNQFEVLKTEFEIEQPDEANFTEDNRAEIKTVLSEVKESLSTKSEEYEVFIASLLKIKNDLEAKITSSQWQQAYTIAKSSYDEKKVELEGKGVDNIDQY